MEKIEKEAKVVKKSYNHYSDLLVDIDKEIKESGDGIKRLKNKVVYISDWQRDIILRETTETGNKNKVVIRPFTYEPLGQFCVFEKPNKSKLIKSSIEGLEHTGNMIPHIMDNGALLLAKPRAVTDLEVGERYFFVADNIGWTGKSYDHNNQPRLKNSPFFDPYIINNEEVAVVSRSAILAKTYDSVLDYEALFNYVVSKRSEDSPGE